MARLQFTQSNSLFPEDCIEKWESLTIQNRFMFGKVMSDKENTLPLLRLLFPDFNIDHIELIEAEKTQESMINSKSVRYDVYVRDDAERVFTLEMQVRNEDSLPLRSRHYASMMDMDILEHGMLYNEMREAYVVFICPFDLFKLGLHRYTFYNRCEEANDLALEDRAQRIFLCAGGDRQDIDDRLMRFLDYVMGKEPVDEYTQQLDHAVRLARKNSVYRREYMRWELELENEKYLARKVARREGLEEGRAVGLEEGRAVGLEEGRSEGRAEGIAVGRAEGREIMNSLIQKLLSDGRTEELKASASDPELQENLLKEYGLV